LARKEKKRKRKGGKGKRGRRKETDIGGIYQAIVDLSPMNCSLSEKN